jgi:hypothetical protein
MSRPAREGFISPLRLIARRFFAGDNLDSFQFVQLMNLGRDSVLSCTPINSAAAAGLCAGAVGDAHCATPA